LPLLNCVLGVSEVMCLFVPSTVSMQLQLYLSTLDTPAQRRWWKWKQRFNCPSPPIAEVDYRRDCELIILPNQEVPPPIVCCFLCLNNLTCDLSAPSPRSPPLSRFSPVSHIIIIELMMEESPTPLVQHHALSAVRKVLCKVQRCVLIYEVAMLIQ